MFFSSATLVVLTVVGCCTYSVDAANTVTLLPNEDTCVSLPPNQNVTYNCSIDEGNVVWQLNEYQLIDRDQFQNMGVMVQEVQSGDFSQIQFLLPNGISFLINNFGTSSFTLECVAVTDEVKVEGRESRTITAYDPGEVPNLQASSDGETTNVTWGPVDLPEPVTYTITITDLDNSMMPLEETTMNTYFLTSMRCERCEISVTARKYDCTSLPTTITVSLPTCNDIGTPDISFKCDKQVAEITVTFTSSIVSVIENSTVSIRNDTEVVDTKSATGNDVFSNNIYCDGIYYAQVSVYEMSQCTQSRVAPLTRAFRCSVTYFKQYAELKCSFTPGTEESPWGVQFVFTINDETEIFTLSRSEAESGEVADRSLAGRDVVAYMWHSEIGRDTQRMSVEVTTVTDGDPPFDIPTDDDDDDDDICGTICIIIIIVVGVLCLILGALLGALIGFYLYKSYSCKDGKKRGGTKLSEATKVAFEEKSM